MSLHEETARRPIAARSSAWAIDAQRLAGALGRDAECDFGASVLFAAIGGLLIFFVDHWLAWLLAAACVQLRLVCNLLDGMVAIEGGKKSSVGAIYNEFPDRIADTLFLVPLGYAAGVPWLGWACALLAALTAYVRVFGGSLGLAQDFSGVMAKQRRMAALTAGLVVQAILSFFSADLWPLLVTAAIIAAGSLVDLHHPHRRHRQEASAGAAMNAAAAKTEATALFRRFLITLVRIAVGARSEWLGCTPKPTRRIYFANHGSHVDTVAVMAALPWQVRRRTHPVAARDYWGKTKLHRFIAETVVCAVLIDRNPEPGSNPLAAGRAPARTRPVDPDLPGRHARGRRRRGRRVSQRHFSARPAFPDIELVPVYLDNLRRILPKGSMLPVPITCTARFGAPLRLEPGEDKGRIPATRPRGRARARRGAPRLRTPPIANPAVRP